MNENPKWQEAWQEAWNQTQKKVEWYAIPPYMKGENWKIVNQFGELVAIFELKSDCLKAVEAVNNFNK